MTTPPSPSSAAAWRSAAPASAGCCRIRAGHPAAEAIESYRQVLGDLPGNLPTKTPPSPISAAAWQSATTNSPACCRKRASYRTRRPSAARRWRSDRSCPTTIPPSRNTAKHWRKATTISAICCRDCRHPGIADTQTVPGPCSGEPRGEHSVIYSRSQRAASGCRLSARPTKARERNLPGVLGAARLFRRIAVRRDPQTRCHASRAW